MPDPPGRRCGIPEVPGHNPVHGDGHNCDGDAPVPTTVLPPTPTTVLPVLPVVTTPPPAGSPVAPPAPVVRVPDPPAPVVPAPQVPAVVSPAALRAAPPVSTPTTAAPEVLGAIQVSPVVRATPAVEEPPTVDDLSSVSTGIPDRIDLSPGFVVTNIGYGALLMLLLLAASQLFNDALRVHHDRIVGHMAGRSALMATIGQAFNRLPRLHPVVSFIVAAGALGLLADPSISLSVATFGQILGMGIALGLIVFAFDGAATFFIRRDTGLRRSFRIFPIAMVVAIGCLLASRVFGVSPGVLYGLFVGAVWVGVVDVRVEGRAYAWGGILLATASMAAWAVHRGVVSAASAPSAGFLIITVDTAAAVLFVAGLQTLIVNLLPMPFLWGESVVAWSRAGWAALLVVALTLYMQFVVRPNPDTVTWKNLWFVLIFVVAAVVFWGYFAMFRWRSGTPPSEPETADEPLTAS